MDKQKILNAIDSLAKLEQDWDSRGSDAISPIAISSAKLFVENIPDDAPDVTYIRPTYDAGIAVGWKTDRKWLEFEFLSDDDFGLGYVEVNLWSKPNDYDTLWEIVRNILFLSSIESADYQFALGELRRLSSWTLLTGSRRE